MEKNIKIKKQKKEMWIKAIRQIPFKRGKDICWIKFNNKKEALNFFRENFEFTPIPYNYKLKKLMKGGAENDNRNRTRTRR